ncbi:MAG TPA: hypothetical protein PLH22_01515 [Candidatus Colwellbacteria bacterium]|nr:hypothetical protein [Candidatus Colwellbacteria bacterium]
MPPVRKQKIRILTWVKAILFAAVGIAAVFVVYELFFAGSARRPAISFEAPANVVLGEDFPLTVVFTNNSEVLIRNVEISLTVPDGAMFADGKNEVRRMREAGTMDVGEAYKETFNIRVLDAAEAEKSFEASVSYLPATLNKSLIVSKDLIASVETPVKTELVVPNEVMAGEEFGWSLDYENTSDKDWVLSFRLTAPKDFASDFSESSVTAKPGEKGRVSFKGSANLPDMSVFSLRVETIGELNGRDYVISDVFKDIAIKASPLSLKIDLLNAESSSGAAKPGSVLRYRLACSNFSNEVFRNVIVRANLRGDMYEFSGLSVPGNASLNSGTIFWNYATDPDLAVLDPGESREIVVEIPLKSDYAVRQASDKNFIGTMTANAEAVVASTGLKLTSVVVFDAKLVGVLHITPKIYFRDAASGIINSGNLPLKVGSPTDFTVHWALSNQASDMSNIEVRAVLPVGVALTGSQKIPVGEFSFDSNSNEVVWKIPKMLANTGVVDKPLEAIFQIRATPIDEFTGSYMPLLRETRSTAFDDFAGVSVSATGLPLNSFLTDDPTVSPLDGLIRG